MWKRGREGKGRWRRNQGNEEEKGYEIRSQVMGVILRRWRQKRDSGCVLPLMPRITNLISRELGGAKPVHSRLEQPKNETHVWAHCLLEQPWIEISKPAHCWRSSLRMRHTCLCTVCWIGLRMRGLYRSTVGWNSLRREQSIRCSRLGTP